MKTSKRQQLAELFRVFLAHDSVIDQPSSLAAYECDGLSAYRKTPLVVVLPETIEQVQQAVRLCNERRIPIVSRGAGTGLSGGALPHEDGIVLSLSKMSQIIKLDKLSRTGVVEPGVRNLAISEAVRQAISRLWASDDPTSVLSTLV